MPPRALPLLSLLVLALAPVAATSSKATGQERPAAQNLAPDRPGIGNGSHVLARGVLQVEAGVAYARVGSSDVYSFGQTVLRYGVGPFEGRLGLNSYVVGRGPRRFDGFEDLSVGAKASLLGRPEDPYRLSGLVTLTVPTGGAELTADDPTITATAVGDWSVTDRVSLSANGAWGTPLYTGDDRWMLTLTPAVSLPGPGDPAFYFGWAGFSGPEVAEDGGSVLESGLTALLGSETQVDVNGGWTPGTGDWFVGGGIAHRFR